MCSNWTPNWNLKTIAHWKQQKEKKNFATTTMQDRNDVRSKPLWNMDFKKYVRNIAEYLK